MLKTTILSAVIFAFMTGSAMAGGCPIAMGAIDAALDAIPDLTDEQRTQVAELRAEGEALHSGGDHGASMAVLAEAKAILGID